MEPRNHDSPTPRLRRSALAWLLVTLALAQAPFILFMPFHIDDGIFLNIAENVARQPLMPLWQPAIWEGRLWSDMMSHAHPPLACYLMYAGLRLGGSHPEPLVHLLVLPFFLLLAAALYAFFRFLELPPLLGTLLAVFAPVVFVSSHTLMMDVPTLALGLTGVVLAFQGIRDDRPGRILAGGACISLGLLTAYSAAFYVLPPAFYALARRRWRHLWLLAVLPAATLAGWFGMVYLVTGRFVPADVLRLLAQYRARPRADWLGRIVYNLSMTGGTILFAASVLAWRWRTLRGKVYLLGVFAAGFLLAGFYPAQGPAHQAVIALLAVAGAVLLGEGISAAVRQGWDATNPLHGAWWALGGWIGTFYLITLLAYPHGAARYQIWLVPPLVGAFLAAWREPNPPAHPSGSGPAPFPLFRRRGFLAVLVAGQVLVAGACAVADLEMARSYRAAVATVFQKYVAPGHTVWVAADWEVRHYALAAGGRTILRYDTRPQPGDLLLKPVRTCPTYDTGYERPKYGRLLTSVEARTTFPVRILDPDVRAGFYSDYWGLVPYWRASPRLPVDVLQVYAIERPLPPDPAREAAENTGMLRPGSSTPLPQ
jgi:hypothetical protein